MKFQQNTRIWVNDVTSLYKCIQKYIKNVICVYSEQPEYIVYDNEHFFIVFLSISIFFCGAKI